MTHAAFSLTEYPLPSGTIVEASAGTGKTYSIAAYVTHALAADESLRIGNILVTTYTRNAAAELRDRIRSRLVTTARLLRSGAIEGRDALDAKLLAARPDERLAMARRLERAVAEFDTATIGTIHSICGRVRRMAGIEPGAAGDEDLLERTVAEAVNDAVVTEAAAGRGWDEGRLVELVTAALRDPFIVPWFDPAGRPPEEQDLLERAAAIVQECVAGVQAAMRAAPSFDDLLRLAWEEVRRPERTGLVAELRRRFRLAIIDEAQDTSRLQWEFFHELFPTSPGEAGDDGRQLVAVGDPKQAIYGFRGADITAYLRFAAGEGAGRPRRVHRPGRGLAGRRRRPQGVRVARPGTVHRRCGGPGSGVAAADPAAGHLRARPRQRDRQTDRGTARAGGDSGGEHGHGQRDGGTGRRRSAGVGRGDGAARQRQSRPPGRGDRVLRLPAHRRGPPR
jgi:exodeoxyribonuclease V beta subunit